MEQGTRKLYSIGAAVGAVAILVVLVLLAATRPPPSRPAPEFRARFQTAQAEYIVGDTVAFSLRNDGIVAITLWNSAP